MSLVSIYRGYRVHFVSKEHEKFRWYAHRPDREPGDPFDLEAETFHLMQAEIDLDEADRCDHGHSYDIADCTECAIDRADWLLDQKKEGDL
jgi:hypothetical protein